MKTFTFRYDPKASPKDLFARLKKAADTRKPDIQRDGASSDSMSAMLSTMTAGRIQLFYAIADQRPDSMYSLAQKLDRDPANVIRDVKVLAGLGLVRLVAEKDGVAQELVGMMHDARQPPAILDNRVVDQKLRFVADAKRRAGVVIVHGVSYPFTASRSMQSLVTKPILEHELERSGRL